MNGMAHGYIAIIVTPSTFRSEGSANYVKYLAMLFRSIGLDVDICAVHKIAEDKWRCATKDRIIIRDL